MRLLSLTFAAGSLAIASGIAAAQNAPSTPQQPAVAASSFATVAVHLTGRYVGSNWMKGPALLEGPAAIEITYGQPHARGRQIVGGVVPFGQVWRLGANLATILRTDVDLTLGGTFLPHGVYSLYAMPDKSGWRLIVNKQVGQWGTEYDASQDVARIPLQSRTVAEPVESLTMYLIPDLGANGASQEIPHGTLKIVWEKTELTAPWKVGH